MQKNEEKDNLRTHRLGRLTVLELMTFLAVLGLLIAWIWQQFFAS